MSLTAGEFKDALDPFHPLSDSTREFMQKEILNTMHEKFITDVELGRGKSFSRVMMPMLFLSIQAVYGQHLRQLSTAGGWRSYVSRDPYTSFKNVLH